MKKLFTLVLTVFAVFALNAQNATLTLEAHDNWGDGTGYQLLVSADTSIFSSFTMPTCGSGAYTGWNYTIPSNAEASDAAALIDGSESISVPAGMYAYIILNPTCAGEGKIYAASSQCDPSYNIVIFEPNKTYKFSLSRYGQNDCVTITVTDNGGGVNINDVESTTFSVYPNPATTNITVKGEGNMEIVNTLGQVVVSEQVNGQANINVANLESGIYFVRMNGTTQKFIKK